MDHDIMNEDEVDAFPAKKYFDHYGWLNYIDSPYKDPELAQRAEKKHKRKLNKDIYPETPMPASPLTTPESKRYMKSSADRSQNTGDATVQQSLIASPHQQATKQHYTEREDAWLGLFHAKLRVAVESGREIKLPGAIPITAAMNAFFALKYANSGEAELPPRTVESLHGKLNRSSLLQERKHLRSMLGGGKSGMVYVPSVTTEELEAYQREGVVVDGAVTEREVEDAEEEEAADKEENPERKRRKIV